MIFFIKFLCLFKDKSSYYMITFFIFNICIFQKFCKKIIYLHLTSYKASLPLGFLWIFGSKIIYFAMYTFDNKTFHYNLCTVCTSNVLCTAARYSGKSVGAV